jgi:hypothetical protein
VVDHAAVAAEVLAVDGLDAVAVGVEQEPAVVVGPVLWAGSRLAVARPAGVDTRAPEGVDPLVRPRDEPDMLEMRRRVLVRRVCEREVAPLREPRAVVARLDPERGEDRRVEALRRRAIRDPDRDVAEHDQVLHAPIEGEAFKKKQRLPISLDVRVLMLRRLGETLGLSAVAAAGPAVILAAVGSQHLMFPMLVHCIVVASAGALAFAASVAVTVVGVRRNDSRSVIVGAAFSTMSAMLFVHALASPGVLIGMNGLVQLAGAGNPPAGVAILSLSAVPALRRPTSLKPLLAIQVLAFVGVVTIGLVGLLHPTTIPVMPGPGGPAANLVFAIGVVLIGAAAHRAARTYLLTRRINDLSVVVGFAWMACALFGLLEYSSMQVGFWMAHVFEVSSLVLLGLPAALDLHRGAQSYPLVGDLSAADLVRREEGFLGARVRALMVRLAE